MANQGPGQRVQITTSTTHKPAPTGFITTQGVSLGQAPVVQTPLTPVPQGVVLHGTPLPGVTTISPSGRGVFLPSHPHNPLGIQKGPGSIQKKTTIITKKTVKAQLTPGLAQHLANQPGLQALAQPMPLPKPAAVVVSTTSIPGQSTVVQVTNTGVQAKVTVTKFANR